MKVVFISSCFCLSVFLCSKLEAAEELQPEVTTNRGLIIKSCFRVDTKESALCAERNVASFFRHNQSEILKLKKMGALDDERPKDLDYSKVKELLIKIWKSETTVAAWFSRMPQITKADFRNYVDQVWTDSYKFQSNDIGSLDKLKQMLILINSLVKLSQAVLL